MFSRQACSSNEPLTKSTLLSLLPSVLDPDNVVEVSTGEIISVKGQPQTVIDSNIKTGVWQVIELQSPRKLLVNSNNWSIISFDSTSGAVCVRFQTPSGPRVLGVTVKRQSW